MGGVHVGEQGIAAFLWHFDGIKGRGLRRDLRVGRIRMPDVTDGVVVAGLLGDPHDLRQTIRPDQRLQDVEPPEMAAERQQPFRIELLIPEEQHVMFKEGAVDFRPGGVVEGLSQIDPADFGAEGARDGRYGDSFTVRHRVRVCAPPVFRQVPSRVRHVRYGVFRARGAAWVQM